MKPTFNISTFKFLGKGIGLMASLPFSLAVGSEKNVSANPDFAAWNEEKEDILERANWLCKEIITDPESLMYNIVIN